MNNKIQIGIIITLGLVLVGALGYIIFPPNAKNNPSSPLFQLQPATINRPENTGSLEQAYPSQVFDLGNWKLTAPTMTTADASLPQDIKQPELAIYQIRPWFMLNHDKTGIIFRAPVNAPTTSNSDYPRSELREMMDNGKEEAVWSTTSGTHTLFLDEAITAVPKNKKHVVAGQIHGDDDDLLVIRLEDSKLYVTRSKSNVYTLDENYTLGKRFTVKFVASDGEIAVYYNDAPTPVHILKKKVSEAYFKVGVYTQSNCETEDSPDLCRADNYGEVTVYQAKVTHK